MIYANNAHWEGGGISLLSIDSAVISNSVIAGNSAHGYGGGVACVSSTPKIRNCVIRENSAGTAGGGLGFGNDSMGAVASCTILGNTAPNGGGVWCQVGSEVVLSNSILWDNADDLSGCLATYSCVEDTGEGDEGEGDIHNDPLLVNSTEGNYHLGPTSPCIDAGANEPWMWEAVDLDGNPRIARGRVDMGAYEHGSTAFMLLRVTRVPGGVELMWASKPAAAYAIWSCVDLLSPARSQEATAPSQGGVTRWTDPNPSGRAKFYRIELR